MDPLITGNENSPVVGDLWLAGDDPATARRASLPAWLLSTVLHATLFVMLGVLVAQRSVAVQTETDRRAGIALVPRDAALQVSPHPAAAAPLPAATAPSQLELMLPASAPGIAASADLPTLPGHVGDIGGAQVTLPAASGFTNSNVPQRLTGGQGQTTLFGVQATGNTFVYVFDRSSSMSSFQGRPIAAAKRELANSLAQLDSVQRFQIIFYNEQPTIFAPFPGSRPQMLFANEENKSLAAAFVRGIRPLGATHHRAALNLALGMQPDAIFFLTDAAEPQLTSGELRDLERRNRGASIHAVEFGTGPDRGDDNFLRRLARENNGQHLYVDVTRLPSGEHPPLPAAK